MGRITYGEGSYGAIKIIGQRCHVYIGKYCSIADHVSVIMLGHNPTNISTFPFKAFPGYEKAAEVKTHPVKYGNLYVENDVWIGYNSTIMGGLTIGNGGIIAAKSFVTKDVKPYSIVGGIPAKHIKYRFSEEVISKLLQIKWWDWPKKKIIDNCDLLSSQDMNQFLEKHLEAT